ncbi:hypothetical protein V7S43_004892 [Phytophthora oleae]|uniref:Uncharacterized protein n=1 Tax=Phytophthora oleae TaxID=2107226 RepID=A0ABD3FY30_9STRA
MCLHPVFKNPEKGLTKMVRTCSTQLYIDPAHPHLQVDEQTVQRNVYKVKECVRKSIIAIMMSIADAESATSQRSGVDDSFDIASLMTMPPLPPVAYTEELTDMFGEHPSQRAQSTGHESRVEEEFDRWLVDTDTLERKQNGEPESVLEF